MVVGNTTKENVKRSVLSVPTRQVAFRWCDTRPGQDITLGMDKKAIFIEFDGDAEISGAFRVQRWMRCWQSNAAGFDKVIGVGQVELNRQDG